MIVNYTPTAVTKLNIDKFTYSTNSAIGINALKYLGDSSITYRLMQSACSTIDKQYENVRYELMFNYNKIDSKVIDSVNLFDMNLQTFNNSDVIYLSSLYGFSKYTGNIYKLDGVYTDKEFTRFSYPCDIIFTSSASGLYDMEYIDVLLRDGVKTSINKPVNNTRITLELKNGFSKTNLNYTDDIIRINLEGLDIYNNRVSETIEIESLKNYMSYYEYSYISKAYVTGNKTGVTVGIHPYIIGDMVIWKDKIIDREYADEYEALVSLNKDDKKLIFYRLLDNPTGYPDIYDKEISVELNINSEEVIYSYIIDNDIVYILTSGNKIYAFPLIIPFKTKALIDINKTKEQSLKVTYINDEENEQYIFTIYPSDKNIDVEILNIQINNKEYKSDILLDLYREGIEDNRLYISYTDMFDSNGESILYFSTSGGKQCILPMFISKNKIDPLFTRNISTLTSYRDNNIEEYSTDISDKTYFLDSYTNSTTKKYKDPNIEGYAITSNSKLYKLSNSNDLILDKYIISNVYNTFYFEVDTGELITHDSITSIRFDNSSKEEFYISLEAAISGTGISGIAITGYEA